MCARNVSLLRFDVHYNFQQIYASVYVGFYLLIFRTEIRKK